MGVHVVMEQFTEHQISCLRAFAKISTFANCHPAKRFTRWHWKATQRASERNWGGASYYDITGGRFDFRKYVEFTHGEILKGFQLRYVYFLDKKSRAKLTVPEIPFSRIDEMGAGMYKGEKISQAERHAIKTPKD